MKHIAVLKTTSGDAESVAGALEVDNVQLDNLRAETDVVPLPRNGSNTVSPTKLNILINLFGSSSGKGAMCLSCFSPLKFQ